MNTVPTNPAEYPSSTTIRPATDVEHDDDGCTTCNPEDTAIPEGIDPETAEAARRIARRLDNTPAPEVDYSHDDVMEAFQAGLLIGRNGQSRKAEGYAEGWLEGYEAHRNRQ